LGDDQVGDRVVDRLAEEDDVVLQQARVDVVRALAPARLLDDHWHQNHAASLPVVVHSRILGTHLTSTGIPEGSTLALAIKSSAALARRISSRSASMPPAFAICSRRTEGSTPRSAAARLNSASSSVSETWMPSRSAIASRSRYSRTRRSAPGRASSESVFQSSFSGSTPLAARYRA